MREKEKSEAFYDDVKKKFQEERDLRLAYRPEGNAQYTSDFTGDLAGYAVDPFLKQEDVREPLNDYTEAVFIGGGFAALLTSVRLLQKGVTDIRIVDRGADVGGAWYWNRYPGIACDVLSHDYLPLLDEIEFVPTRNYSSGREILNHCQTVRGEPRMYGVSLRYNF